MQLVYDFLYKRHSPTFLIFLCTSHSDYPVDSDYPLKYSIGEVTSSPDNASLPMATVHRRNSLSRRLRSAAQCRASVAMPARGCAVVALNIYWTSSSYSAAPEEAASRFGRRPARLSPSQPRVRTRFEPTRPRVSSQSLYKVISSAPLSHTNLQKVSE